nr:putative reverse transcriptase domain-containing protein [Tanacetum cinerariifolium]
MQAARDRQKSYADLKHKPMEFQVRDKVMLKVSPWKGVVRFGKQGKLNPRYVGPFKVLERIGDVAYKLGLPKELSRVHNTFHQYTVNHHIFNAHHDLLGSQKKLNINLTKVNEQMTSLTSMCELACKIVQKNLEEKQLEEEQAAKGQNWKLPVCYDDDDDEEGSNSLEDNIIFELPPYSAVTHSEPIESLSMGDEHLDTIPVTKSDEFIKFSVETLVLNPSESEGEHGCDVLACFTTFSNVLYDADYDSDSSDDQSLSDEDVPEKIYSNPLFDEEIIPMKIDLHPFNAESDLIGSIPNHDSSIIISSKIDSLFDEFAGELTLLKSIPSGIDKTDCYPEEEKCFTKRLFDSHMEEIDLSFNLNDPMPLGIEEDDDDSERDIPILEELPNNYSFSLPNNESYHFDIPSPYRPPAKPPDGNTGTLNIKMMGDVSDKKGCQKPGHLAARLGCAETKVTTWDDLAFKLITL